MCMIWRGAVCTAAARGPQNQANPGPPALHGGTNALPGTMNDAKAWWEQRRSAGWSLEQHLSHPTVNCTSGYEIGLAHAVASMVPFGG